jgi:hypothetical protein
MLVLFFNKDEKAMKLALEENSIISKELRGEIIERLKQNKTAKLVLRLEFPRKYLLIK